MTRISNYHELVQEKARLQHVLATQKEEIRNEVKIIKENLRPLFSIISFLGSFKKDGAPSLLKLGTQTGVNILTRNTLLANAGWVAKMIVPVLAGGVSGALFDRVKKIFSKKKATRESVS